MTCSWDEGDRERTKKLTSISNWRELTESDLQQYIASSEEDEDEDEEDSSGGSDNGDVRERNEI